MLNPDLDPNPATSAVERLKGVWKLVRFDVEAQSTGVRRPALGDTSKGRLILHSSGTLMVVITARGRRAPNTPEERTGAFDSTVAYSGHFDIHGDRFTIAVDISWHEAWCNAPQVFTWRLDGKRLELTSAWRPDPGDATSLVRQLLLWERET